MDYLQLVFIISDGVLSSRDQTAKWVREAAARHQLLVFLIIEDPTRRDSILEQQVDLLISCSLHFIDAF